jgi:hypothetical protein
MVHDTQHKNIKHKDTQHNNIHHKETEHNRIHHKDIQYNNIHYNDIQHIYKKSLSSAERHSAIVTVNAYAECLSTECRN